MKIKFSAAQHGQILNFDKIVRMRYPEIRDLSLPEFSHQFSRVHTLFITVKEQQFLSPPGIGSPADGDDPAVGAQDIVDLALHKLMGDHFACDLAET